MFTALSGISPKDLQSSTSTGSGSSTPGSAAHKRASKPVPQTDTVKLSVTHPGADSHLGGKGAGEMAGLAGSTSSQANDDLYGALSWPQLLSKVAASGLSGAAVLFSRA